MCKATCRQPGLRSSAWGLRPGWSPTLQHANVGNKQEYKNWRAMAMMEDSLPNWDPEVATSIQFMHRQRPIIIRLAPPPKPRQRMERKPRARPQSAEERGRPKGKGKGKERARSQRLLWSSRAFCLSELGI